MWLFKSTMNSRPLRICSKIQGLFNATTLTRTPSVFQTSDFGKRHLQNEQQVTKQNMRGRRGRVLTHLASHADILLARHAIFRDEPKECLRGRLLLTCTVFKSELISTLTGAVSSVLAGSHLAAAKVAITLDTRLP